MTENVENIPIYVCDGCESEMPDPNNSKKERYGKFEACPLCMTNEELYELEFGDKRD